MYMYSAGLGQIFLHLRSNFGFVYVSSEGPEPTLVADVFSTKISYVGLL